MQNTKRYIGLASALTAAVVLGGCGTATSAGTAATTAVAGKGPTSVASASTHATPASPTPSGRADLNGFYSDLAKGNFAGEGYLGPIDRGQGKVAVVWKNPTPERRAQVEQMAAQRGLSVEFLNAMMDAAELQALADRMSAAQADLLASYGWQYGGVKGMDEKSPTVPRIAGHQTRSLTAAEQKARDDAIAKVAGAQLPIDEEEPGGPAAASASPSH